MRGWNFFSFLQALYINPSTCIRLRGYLSDAIFIRSVTRQGCPLSPILFVITIETLAAAIHAHPDILGIVSRGRQQKCALFANDLLLFLTSPHTSILSVLHLLQLFGSISGLIVNWKKSEALHINLDDDALQS